MIRKFLLPILLFTVLTLIPKGVIFAASESACSSALIEKNICTCWGGTDATNSETEIFKGIANITSCQQACTGVGAANNFDEINYQFQCANSTGTPFVPDDGNGTVFVTSDAERVTSESATKDPLIPNLNVDIPGLDLSNAVTADTTEVGGYDVRTGRNVKSNLIGLYVEAVYRYLIVAGSLIAVVMLMIGGLEYAISAGNTKRVERGKERMRNAVVGMILLLLAYNIAFLLNPKTVTFDALMIPGIEGVDTLPPAGEDLNVVPVSTLTGDVVPITGDHLVLQTGNPVLDPRTVTALQNAANAFNDETQGNIVIKSATRDLKKQATLFYNNCLATASKTCSVPTCNPASSSVIKRVGRSYQLVGALEGVTDATTIINTIVDNANAGNCPHTSAIAVDAWCEDAGGGYKADTECHQDLINAMTENGFCRLGAEVWHFELQSGPAVSSACSTQNNSLSYTTGGKTYTPPSDCQRWDFDDHYCVTYKVQ